MLLQASSRTRGASTAGFLRFVKQQPVRRQPRHRFRLSQSRWQSGTAIATETTTTTTTPTTATATTNIQPSSDQISGDAAPTVCPASLSVQSKRRLSEIGVQHLSDHMYKQVFLKDNAPAAPKELVQLSKRHLELHNLYGKNTDSTPPIGFDVPKLQGNSLDEHFHKLGIDSAEPFLSYAKQFAHVDAPARPKKWIRRSGWVKYPADGSRPRAQGPDKEKMLCFDVEVLYKDNPFAIMACAISPTAWYVWLSPWLLGESESKIQLIPLGNPSHDRIIVGHNIGYDRGRVLEEYDLKQTRNAFLDTMSLHVAVNGMCSQQRPTWLKHKKNRELRDKISKETDNAELAALLARDDWGDEEEEAWVERSSINSLRDVAHFHLKETIDKEIRNDFGELDRAGILGKLNELLDYCAGDVEITQRVYQKVFPHFLEVCPHPVSFAALRHLSSVILPVNRSWDVYVKSAEAKYEELSQGIQERLISLAEKAAELKKEEQWADDPWLRQLDWSEVGVIKYVGGKKANDPLRLDLRQKKPGMPKWYKGLFPKRDEPMKLTVRTRIAPLLLRLTWDGYPLTWSDKYGWMVRVPLEDASKYNATQLVQCELFDEPIEMIRDDTTALYFKLPHKDGPTARCTNPLTKSYLTYFDKGILSSEYSYAKEALDMNASCSYWISARARIKSQMVVYESDKNPKATDRDSGYIIPQIIPMGTITRRAVENTWLTASNAKKNRVGSELKAMVKAPEGYSFVGADVDSEELWIASVIGDATFKLHGGNAIGFMTLEGTKAAGTDLHSRTASILGITRNDAKVFNYGRIYGAGLKFAATLLRQFNPSLSEEETLDIAGKLYANTKGTKTSRKALYKRSFWRGGTESFVFNKLEEFAEQERPRTPVLGAGITEALMRKYISKGGYLTSRINWAIQSSGVDYLHLLIVGMDYLIRRFNIHARLAITVHDEIRYLVKNEDKYRAAMALQVANLWTRAMFAQQVGIEDLPQSCAYFSAVDIDHVLRKEVDLNCVTPSHPTPIPPGESIDITQLLEKGADAYLDPAIIPAAYAPNIENIPYTPRVPVMKSLAIAQDPTDLSFLKAQITDSDEELRQILKGQKKVLFDSIPKIPRLRKSFKYHSQKEMPTMYEPFKASFPRQANLGGNEGWIFEKMPPRAVRTSRPRL